MASSSGNNNRGGGGNGGEPAPSHVVNQSVQHQQSTGEESKDLSGSIIEALGAGHPQHFNFPCSHSNCLIAAIRGFRNGLYYGGKVRFAHAIVMAILF